jgi:restriction system protein
MALWLVRAGRSGEYEDLAFENNLVVISWPELADLSGIKTREELKALLAKTYPDESPGKLVNWESQLWSFVKEMQPGDLVALPRKHQPVIAIGEVAGPYQYRPDFPEVSRHTRPVKWLEEKPRSDFAPDILYSLGASMTICRVQRNNAEERVRALITGTGRDGGEPPIDDLEQYALDRIREYIAQKFKGHNLERLAAAVIEALGYKVQISPEGPDRGVDIFAGYGPLGFDHPRIVVQVKSGNEPVDVKLIRELQGVMKNFGADHGLLISWSGYKGSVPKEANQHFFEVRLWDSDDLIKALLSTYERLPAAIQAELPLKQIWVLVPEEE